MAIVSASRVVNNMDAPLNSGSRVPEEIGDQLNFPSGWRYLIPDKWDRTCKHESVIVEAAIAACTVCGLTAFRGRRSRARHYIDTRRTNSAN